MKRDELLDLNDVLQHPGRKVAVDVSTEFPEDPDIVLSRPLTGFLEAVSTGNLLLVTGEFKTGVIADCARCSEPIEIDVVFSIDEQFPVEGTPSSYSHQDFASVKPDEPYPLFEGNALIVQNLLREDLIVAMPVQPLCQYGWEGECPVAAARGIAKRDVPATGPFDKLKSLIEVDGPEEIR